MNVSTPVSARSKAWVCGRLLAGIAGSNPSPGRDVCLLCVLSGRGLCVGLITRLEGSYRGGTPLEFVTFPWLLTMNCLNGRTHWHGTGIIF
jgi:hypothetical protein